MELLQQTLGRRAPLVLVQQDHAPHRDVVFAFRNQLGQHGCADDRVDVGAVAGLDVAVVVNSAHIAFYFDFDDGTVFAGTEFTPRFFAGRAHAVG